MRDMVRAFLSINITNQDLLSRLQHVQGLLDRDAAKLKLVEKDNIHFTLRFFGDVSYSQLDKIETCFNAVRFDEFSIDIRGVGAFPTKRRPRVIWVGVKRNENLMIELKSQFDRLLKSIGYQTEKKDFTPHATIARVRRVLDGNKLSMNLDSLSETDIGMMSVEEFTLMKSTLTPSGPIYEIIWKKRAS